LGDGLDVPLHRRRRRHGPELAVGINHDSQGVGGAGGYIADAGNKGARLERTRADADGAELARNAVVAYVDIFVAGREISACTSADRHVAAAGVVLESKMADGHVSAAYGVGKKRGVADGDVCKTACIGCERRWSDSDVGITCGVK